MIFSAVKWLAIIVFGSGLALLLAAQFGLLRGTPPADLGVRDNRLKRPAKTPNSVSSQADLWPDNPQRAYARVAPLLLRGDGPGTIARLKVICDAARGAKVVISKPDYLYVQFQTRVLKFVDDVEFWYDPAAGMVQVRSASRIGRKDFGVNRERIEFIRGRLQAG